MTFLFGLMLVAIPTTTAVACIVSVMRGPDRDAAAYVIGLAVTGALAAMLFWGLWLMGLR